MMAGLEAGREDLVPGVCEESRGSSMSLDQVRDGETRGRR